MQETLAVRDLDEALVQFDESHDWPYSVAWIDCLARGAKLGRGLMMRGAFMERGALPPGLASDPLRRAPTAKLTIPVDAPSLLLNRASIRPFNALRYGRGRLREETHPIHFDRFFFLLDRINAWNRLYGRRGFVQYQCVLPRAESPAGLAALLARLSAAGPGSFLAVLKLFGPGGNGLLSFPMDGYTLALDFPLRKGVLALLDDLDEITHRHGGRVYLAKDARCAPERVRQGYPRLEDFQAIRAEAAETGRRFASALSRRLAL